MIKAINAGTTQNLTGSEDKYSDIGASKWSSNIKTLAANNIIPNCSSLEDKFCPSRRISVGEVSYMVNQLVNKSLVSSDLFNVTPFQSSWTANGGEVADAGSTAVSNPNAETMLAFQKIIQMLH